VADCLHGFPEGQCLICSTLARSSSQGAGSRTQVAEKLAPPSLTNGAGTRQLPVPTTSGRQSAKTPKGDGPEKRGGPGRTVAVGVVVILAGLIAWALFRGVVDLALRLAEFIVLAVVAGWVGYKIGHWQGERSARKHRDGDSR